MIFLKKKTLIFNTAIFFKLITKNMKIDIQSIHFDADKKLLEFITHKMWSFFAYRNPEPELIQRLAGEFHRSSLDIKTLLRAMMTAPEGGVAPAAEFKPQPRINR